jgi:L-alanine-DL-glutamate epimerase-like enolase superfamily enzyme
LDAEGKLSNKNVSALLGGARRTHFDTKLVLPSVSQK